jgi:PMC2NT (NUC016) domain
MDSSQTPLSKSAFDGYYAQLQTAALKATKHAAGLPTSADLAFHRSVDSDLAKDLESCSKKVVSMSNVLLDLMSTIGNSKSAKGKGKARLQDEDDFLDRFGALIVEPMDQLLERAVRSVSQPFVLRLPYPGYRSGSLLRQDKSACDCHQARRAKKEVDFVKAPGTGHTTCIASPKTATQIQAEGRSHK